MIKRSKKITSAVISVLAVAILLISSLPVSAATTSKRIALDASAITTGSERFAAYLFDGLNPKFIDMTTEDGQYVAYVPTSYSKMIFCRMNGNTMTNSWSNCWNQTDDLRIDDGNTYTITGWGSGNKMEGTWSQTESADGNNLPISYTSLVGSFNNWDCTLNPITVTYRGGAAEVFLNKGSYEFKFVSVYGTTKYWFGADNATVTDQTSTGIKVKSPADNIKLNITKAGTYSFYFRMDTGTVSVSQVSTVGDSYISVAGSFNNWDTSKNVINITYRGGSTYVDLTPGEYEFKVVYVNGNNKTWYGADNAYIKTNSNEYAPAKLKSPGNNIKFKVTEAGTYAISYRIDLGTANVSKAYN